MNNKLLYSERVHCDMCDHMGSYDLGQIYICKNCLMDFFKKSNIDSKSVSSDNKDKNSKYYIYSYKQRKNVIAMFKIEKLFTAKKEFHKNNAEQTYEEKIAQLIELQKIDIAMRESKGESTPSYKQVWDFDKKESHSTSFS